MRYFGVRHLKRTRQFSRETTEVVSIADGLLFPGMTKKLAVELEKKNCRARA